MNNPPLQARTFRYQEILIGMKEERDYVLSPEVYEHFLAAFDDRSPIHVEEPYALQNGYAGKVMHGTLLNGFLSHFVGMHFPGRLSLLLAVDLRFSQPSYLGEVIRLEALVSQTLDARQVVVLDVTLTNLTRNCTAARGRVQVMLREEP